ncbi:MAG TPA: flagellar biosynthetic protein FliQ [Opitutaceae bacterium]|nr:flagellar biosynthetic protein FliQ [Opitutaceae bacterium]
MNPEVAIDVFKTTVIFAIYLAAPFLISMLVIGLITSLIQSVTSIQEPTLTFTPKLLVFAVISLVVAPWLLRTLGEFTISIFTRMSTLAH